MPNNGLTKLQRLVLAACTGSPTAEDPKIPHGVYRSLVYRGLLMHVDVCYHATSEGRDLLASEMAERLAKGRRKVGRPRGR